MLSVLISVLVTSSIAAALALILVVAEKYIVNYGPCDIDINGQKQLTVEGGSSLLSVLVENKIFIPSACGGRGTCGYCTVKALEGAGPLLPTETPFLTTAEIKDNIRLSCQVKVRNDIRIEIPEELLSVLEYECVCTEITDLTYDMKRFRFELKDPPTIDFVPGKYVQLLCPRYKGSPEEVYRAYSIASDPLKKELIELIIRLVPNGICTTYCFDYLKVGEPVKLNGPYGEFGLSDTEAPMIWIAGGSGMAPFVSILHHMQNAGNTRRITYFFGANQVKDLCLIDQMKQFDAALANFTFVPVVAAPAEGEQWSGQTGLVTEAVERCMSDITDHEAYLCGSPGMIDASIKVLVKLGVAEGNIFFDKF
jgi:Na+-transporting NADH:ubiquinone oxidoreductase subunit F